MVKETIKRLLPIFLLDRYYLLLAFFGAFFYVFPSRKLVVVGVTGTNGKSTVVEMCDLILREAGYQVASVSSVRFRIGEKEWRNELKMTMPGRFRLQKFLRQAVDAGCQYAVLEVTSEGIKQHRHRFIDFDVAVLTNLTPEHIESHGSFERYKAAKGYLFRALTNSKSRGALNSKQIINHKLQIPNRKVSIVNLDDENVEYFLQFPADEKIGYGIKMSNVKCQISNVIKADDIQSLSTGFKFRLKNPDKNIYLNTYFNLPLLGEFNIYNALAAICVGLSQGIDLETIKGALEKMRGVPGRMEVVVQEPFTVIVDYAHTPDALQKVYATIKNSQLPTSNSQLICVLGAAGGGRDKWKRPEMGKIAAKYCDQIILTNEDPYDENPSQILSEIESGILNVQFPIFKLLDRRQAIRKALNLARAGDVVIITGKGCEPWMCVAGGRKIPWDDRELVREELNKLELI